MDVSPSSTPDAYNIPGVVQEAIKTPGVDDDTQYNVIESANDVDNVIESANDVDSFEPTIHDSKANLPPPAMEPSIIETPTEAIQPDIRGSVLIRQPTQRYVLTTTSKKYSYAATQIDQMKYEHLFATIEEYESFFDRKIVEFVFNQLTISAATKLWGAETTAAAAKEMKQLHWCKSFQPVHWKDLSSDQHK